MWSNIDTSRGILLYHAFYELIADTLRRRFVAFCTAGEQRCIRGGVQSSCHVEVTFNGPEYINRQFDQAALIALAMLYNRHVMALLDGDVSYAQRSALRTAYARSEQ